MVESVEARSCIYNCHVGTQGNIMDHVDRVRGFAERGKGQYKIEYLSYW